MSPKAKFIHPYLTNMEYMQVNGNGIIIFPLEIPEASYLRCRNAVDNGISAINLCDLPSRAILINTPEGSMAT